MADRDEDLVRRYWEALNPGRFELLDDLLTADFLDHKELRGIPPTRDGLKQKYAMLRAGFPDFGFTVEDLFSTGDRVAVRLTVRGTHDGEFMARPPTGKQFVVGSVGIFRTANSRIVEGIGASSTNLQCSGNSEPREVESTIVELQPVDLMRQRSREGRTSLGSSIDAQLRNATDLFPAFGNQRSPNDGVEGVDMSERTIKSGGVAGVLAGALFILTAVIDTVAPIDVDYDSPHEYVYVAASTVAFLAVVVAVIGVRALAARTGRPARLATVAAWLVGVGYGVVGLLNVVSLLAGGRSLVMVRLGFAVVILGGSAILGVVVLRMHLLPWWCGVLLIVAFPVGHFANALFAGAENILLALLWGSVGVSSLVRATAPVEPAVRQSRRVS